MRRWGFLAGLIRVFRSRYKTNIKGLTLSETHSFGIKANIKPINQELLVTDTNESHNRLCVLASLLPAYSWPGI